MCVCVSMVQQSYTYSSFFGEPSPLGYNARTVAIGNQPDLVNWFIISWREGKGCVLRSCDGSGFNEIRSLFTLMPYYLSFTS